MTLSQRARILRRLPLEPVAERLGYVRDRWRRRRWRRPGSLLAIDGERFFDHLAGRGGGGAIDLVMQARGCGFREALAFLGDPPPAATKRVPGQPPALRLPAPSRRHWPRVREHLVSERGLDPRLLDACRRDGSLRADRRRNAVFLCRDPAGNPVGAELAGTVPRPDGSRFKAMAPGSRKARGAFCLAPSASPPKAALLVESAVDALSLRQLRLPAVPPSCLLVSVAGLALRLPAWLSAFPPMPLLCGYDNDPAGDRAARALCRRHPAIRRLRPRGAKDWNDLLRLLPRP